MEDFLILIRQNYDGLASEVGKMPNRPSSIRWCEWVSLAGGRVRGNQGGNQGGNQAVNQEVKENRMGRDTRFLPNTLLAGVNVAGGSENLAGSNAGFAGMVGDREARKERAEIDADILASIWPLHMVDFKDSEQILVLFKLLRRVPQVIGVCMCVCMHECVVDFKDSEQILVLFKLLRMCLVHVCVHVCVHMHACVVNWYSCDYIHTYIHVVCDGMVSVQPYLALDYIHTCTIRIHTHIAGD